MIKKFIELDNVPISRNLEIFSENVEKHGYPTLNQQVKLDVVTYWFFYFYSDFIINLDDIGEKIQLIVDSQIQYSFIQVLLERLVDV